MIIIDKHEDTRKIIRTVIYIRFSSHKQLDSYSIEYQQEECLKHIERKGYKFINAYIDEAKTGKKTAGREALEKMLYDAGRDKFDKIIVFSFSRSFRNTRDALNTNHELMEKHGIVIESVIEPIDLSSPHGRFSGTNLFAMHELQSDITAAHVRSGMYIAARQGYYLGGHIPLGYDVYNTGEFTRGKPRKKYCINEDEAKIVKSIFQMFLDGFSINYIRDELVKQNVTIKKTGNYIPASNIGRMLKDEFFCGIRKFNIKGYEPLYIDGAIPAIIDRETFEAVQAKLKALKDKPKPRRRTNRFYPLTGKIVCAKCGGYYNGTTIKGRCKTYTEYSNYICYAKKNLKTCDGKNIRKEYLENYCIEQIKKHILTPKKIKEIATFILSQTDGTPDLIKDDFTAAEKRKRKVLEIIKNMKRDLYEMDEAEAEAQNELIADYSKELNDLNEKLARLENLEVMAISEGMIIDFLEECALNINSPDPHILKTVFDKLIEKIIIYDDKVELYLLVFPFVNVTLNELSGSPHYSLSTTLNRSLYDPFANKRKKK